MIDKQWKVIGAVVLVLIIGAVLFFVQKSQDGALVGEAKRLPTWLLTEKKAAIGSPLIEPLKSLPLEICGNGIDDDKNGKADCADSACDLFIQLEGKKEALCAKNQKFTCGTDKAPLGTTLDLDNKVEILKIFGGKTVETKSKELLCFKNEQGLLQWGECNFDMPVKKKGGGVTFAPKSGVLVENNYYGCTYGEDWVSGTYLGLSEDGNCLKGYGKIETSEGVGKLGEYCKNKFLHLNPIKHICVKTDFEKPSYDGLDVTKLYACGNSAKFDGSGAYNGYGGDGYCCADK